jgi:hypothetical protein
MTEVEPAAGRKLRLCTQTHPAGTGRRKRQGPRGLYPAARRSTRGAAAPAHGQPPRPRGPSARGHAPLSPATANPCRRTAPPRAREPRRLDHARLPRASVRPQHEARREPTPPRPACQSDPGRRATTRSTVSDQDNSHRSRTRRSQTCDQRQRRARGDPSAARYVSDVGRR